MKANFFENPTIKFSKGVKERVDGGGDIISLGLGQPNYEVPEIIIQDTMKAIQDKEFGYAVPLGVVNLRKAIAQNYTKDQKHQLDINNILVTPGVRQAIIFSLMCILEPEDEVIVFTPHFTSYHSMIYLAQEHVKIVEYSLSIENTKIDFDQLESLITSKTKAILCNFPHNPTGAILDENDYIRLSSFILKHKLYAISDEIYEKVVFSKESYLLSMNPELKDHLFVVSGFSKSLAMTGWRLGYVVFPTTYTQMMSALSLHMNACTNTFIQHGAVKAFEIPNSYFDQYNSVLINNRDRLVALLDEFNVKYFYPHSGYFCFACIEEFGLDSNEFTYRLVTQKGVALTPGLACGKRWDQYVRISFAVDFDTFSVALIRLREFFESELQIIYN